MTGESIPSDLSPQFFRTFGNLSGSLQNLKKVRRPGVPGDVFGAAGAAGGLSLARFLLRLPRGYLA